MKIWYQSTLSFNRYPNYEKALTTHLKGIASAGTEVVVRGRQEGIDNNITTAEITKSQILYHSFVSNYFIRALLDAESSGADVFIAASFSEPILTELRALANIPVVSMPEACFQAACMSAPKVAFVTLNRLVCPFIEKSINLHKWRDRIVGIHFIEGDITEPELEQNLNAPGKYVGILENAVRVAIADGAQVVIPAEGVLGVMAACSGLSEVDGVPVIDAVGTSLLFAELAYALKHRTGVSQSRAAYPLPSEDARNLVARLSEVF